MSAAKKVFLTMAFVMSRNHHIFMTKYDKRTVVTLTPKSEGLSPELCARKVRLNSQGHPALGRKPICLQRW